jgi:hypothetical protein
MDNHLTCKKLVFVIFAATEKKAQMILLKKRAVDTSLLIKTTIQYIN